MKSLFIFHYQKSIIMPNHGHLIIIINGHTKMKGFKILNPYNFGRFKTILSNGYTHTKHYSPIF